jgi:hypothetical protein
MPWKCKNVNCGKTFPMLARISTEKKQPYGMESIRVVVERFCCPYCESTEFEEVKEPSLQGPKKEA